MKHYFAGILLAGMLAFGTPADAQSSCRDYEEYREAIETIGGERLIITGPSAVYAPRGITRVEVYMNPETRTLSYMFIRPGPEGEVMCLGDYLTEFEFVTPEDAEPEGDPT